MPRDLIMLTIVDTFQDINFAALGVDEQNNLIWKI